MLKYRRHFDTYNQKYTEVFVDFGDFCQQMHNRERIETEDVNQIKIKYIITLSGI